MRATELHELLGTRGCAIVPVIHALDERQVARNLDVAFGEGAPGALLINHDYDVETFLPVVRGARERWPDAWLGVNFLAVTGADAFPVLGQLAETGCRIDAYWADDARIDERLADGAHQPEAARIAAVRESSGWRGLYFGGVAFKKQREVAPDDYATAATRACDWMDVVTTSGVATGHAARASKVATFRDACGDRALALASGVTSENFSTFDGLIDCALVATGINAPGDFYNIDRQRLATLLRRAGGEP